MQNRSYVFWSVLFLLIGVIRLPAQVHSVSPEWERCSNTLYDPGPIKDVRGSWNSDADYWITRLDQDSSKGKKSIYVAGDIIHITKKDFDSFSRAQNDPRTDIETITFDAREIVVDMPLVFTSGKIILLGEKVIFTSHGQFVLTSHPVRAAQPGTDGIEIIADVLDLTAARAVPFNFVTRQQNWPSGSSRGLKIAANKVSLNGTSPTDWLAFFKTRTLDSRAAVDSGSSYDLAISSSEAANQYQQTLKTRAIWPFAFSSKVIRHFALAPYQDDNKLFLQKMIESYLPVMNSERYGYPRALLQKTLASIAADTDFAGRAAAYTPRTDYKTWSEYFNTANKNSQEALDLWLTELSGSSSDNTRVQKEKQLREALASQTAALSEKATGLAQQLDEIEGKINSIEQQKSQKQDEIEKAKVNLQRCVQEQQDKAKQAQQIDGALNIATFMGTAATAIFAPAAAPYVAGSLSAGRIAVMKHQAGEDVTTLSDLVELGKRSVEAGKQMQERFNKASDAYKKIATAIKNKNASNLGDAVTEASQASTDVLNWAKQLGSPNIDPKLLETKIMGECAPTQLNQLTAEFAGMNSDQGKFRGDLLSVGQQITAIGADIEVNKKRLDELGGDIVKNDKEMAARQQLGILTWDHIFSLMDGAAPDTARAYSYLTGGKLDIPDAVRVSNSIFLERHNTIMQMRTKVGAENEIDLNDLRKESNQRYLDFLTQQQSLLTGQQKFWEQTFPAIILPHQFKVVLPQIAPKAQSDKAKYQFINALNQEIRRQMKMIRSGLKQVYPLPIPIPMNSEQLFANSGNWAQLESAQVTRITFKSNESMRDKVLDISVVHPGFGNISKGESCYFVDFRSPSAEQNRAIFPSRILDDGRLQTGTSTTSGYAKLPYSSPYYIELLVTRSRDDDDWTSWSDVPVISQVILLFNVSERKR